MCCGSSALPELPVGNVGVGVPGKGNLGAKPKGEGLAEILAAIRVRRR